MGIKKSGKLKHAPLFYTLAMIRFEDQRIGPDQISKIRAELESNFPCFDECKIKVVLRAQLANEKTVEAKEITEYHGENVDRTTGFLLRDDGLFLQTVAYEKYNVFEEILKKVIEAIHRILKFEYYQAIGIRYIDYIKHGSLASIDGYMQSNLLGFPLNDDKTKTIQTNCETLAEQGKFAIRLRCSKLPGQSFPIPVDLQQPARYLDVKAKLSPEPPLEDIILLDTDCFQKELVLRKFDLKAILKEYDKMHKVASTAFKMAVADDAWKEWRK